MITNRELRIGNYINYVTHKKTELVTVDIALMNELDMNSNSGSNRLYHPIPMTNTILDEFGFNGWGSDGEYLFDKDDFWVITWHSRKNRFFIEAVEVEFKYLHELQNLYYVLTGNELKREEKIKEKA